ncbi:dnaJ homolog subfamily C member 16-like isoform X2 [Ptychodera flava]|uniref:dnaJ homolog subfamily C member 16-like isoform X2 n=1 Tax=Ptychodera flava TaxID=63121 RepID=UPI00396A6898
MARLVCKIVTVVCVICFLFITFSKTHADIDPYKELGVDRSASTQDIKKAYKRLAKEWHPDKNKDPSAGERFMKINAAYEILSDEQKKQDYDHFGFTDSSDHRGHHRHNPFQGFNFGNFRNFDFGDGFGFKFESSQRAGREQRHRINYNGYQSNILPISHRKPYLIFVTGDWCFSCKQAEGPWENIVKELEPLGVGIAVVNSDYERRLPDELGIGRIPAMVAVLKGRTYRFKNMNSLGVKSTKDFLQGLFPTGLVNLLNDNSYQYFLNGWRDNKPRALLFSTKSEVQLLFLLVALENKERVAFGMVPRSSLDTQNVRRKYNVVASEPTLLIFREDTEHPVHILEAKEMKSGKLRDAVRSHYFLTLPRLSSQAVFEQLCPVAVSSHQKRFCVILITQDTTNHDEARSILRDFIKENSYSADNVRFSYVYEGTQRAFVQALSKGQVLQNDWNLPLAVVWREKTFRVMYDWLPTGWSGKLENAEEDKKSLKTFLDQVMAGKKELPKKSDIKDLEDENYSILSHTLTQVTDRLWSVWRYFSSSRWEDAFWCAVLFVISAPLLYKHIHCISQANERMPREPSQANNSTEDRYVDDEDGADDDTGHVDDDDFQVKRLTPEMYQRLVGGATPRKHVFVVLTDRERQRDYQTEFRNVALAPSFRESLKSRGSVFTYLEMEPYHTWFERLRGIEQTSQTFGKEYAGNVLFITGYRKCYRLFTPDTNTTHAEGLRRRNSGNLFAGLDRWLERMLDGAVEKISVQTWPPLSGS